MCSGELGLDGRVHGVRGALPIAAAASRAALGALMVPAVNAPEAALADGPPVFGVETLAEAVAHFRGEAVRAPTTVDAAALLAAAPLAAGDLAEVRGQPSAKRVRRRPQLDGMTGAGSLDEPPHSGANL